MASCDGYAKWKKPDTIRRATRYPPSTIHHLFRLPPQYYHHSYSKPMQRCFLRVLFIWYKFFSPWYCFVVNFVEKIVKHSLMVLTKSRLGCDSQEDLSDSGWQPKKQADLEIIQQIKLEKTFYTNSNSRSQKDLGLRSRILASSVF